jgi:hypothetical protein
MTTEQMQTWATEAQSQKVSEWPLYLIGTLNDNTGLIATTRYGTEDITVTASSKERCEEKLTDAIAEKEPKPIDAENKMGFLDNEPLVRLFRGQAPEYYLPLKIIGVCVVLVILFLAFSQSKINSLSPHQKERVLSLHKEIKDHEQAASMFRSAYDHGHAFNISTDEGIPKGSIDNEHAAADTLRKEMKDGYGIDDWRDNN